MINIGLLTANRGPAGDECFTPFYAVEPILKYLDKSKTYWLPFDEHWSAFVQLMMEKGFKIVISSIRDGEDFFEYEPPHYDIIISNPPFSKKDEVLKRLYELGKPYAILLPLNSLQGQRRFQYLDGIEILTFDKRIGYHQNFNFQDTTESAFFASAYFCKGILPSNLIVEELTKYNRPLINFGREEEF